MEDGILRLKTIRNRIRKIEHEKSKVNLPDERRKTLERKLKAAEQEVIDIRESMFGSVQQDAVCA